MRRHRLLTLVDEKVKKLYEYHELNQQIKLMCFDEFVEFVMGNPCPAEYRHITDEIMFENFMRHIPAANPYKQIIRYALKEVN